MSLDYSAVERLKSAAGGYVVVSGTHGRYAARAKGFSIWFPTENRWHQKYLSQHQRLKFSQLTRWDKSPRPFQKVIRREDQPRT